MSVLFATHKAINKIIQVLASAPLRVQLCYNVDGFYERLSIPGTINNYDRENELGRRLLEVNRQAFAQRYGEPENADDEFRIEQMRKHVESYVYDPATGIKMVGIAGENNEQYRLVVAYMQICFWQYQVSDLPDISSTVLWKELSDLKENLAFHLIKKLPGGEVWG